MCWRIRKIGKKRWEKALDELIDIFKKQLEARKDITGKVISFEEWCVQQYGFEVKEVLGRRSK